MGTPRARTKKTAAKPELTTAEKRAMARRPRHVEKLLMRGDLVDEFNEAQDAFNAALATPPTSLAGIDEDHIKALAQRVQDITDEMAESTITATFEALSSTKWNRLKDAHPPRPNEHGGVLDEDRSYGVNIVTFFPAALAACTIAPDDLTYEMWADLLGEDGLTDGQQAQVVLAVWMLNKGVVSVPFLPAVSKILSSGK